MTRRRAAPVTAAAAVAATAASVVFTVMVTTSRGARAGMATRTISVASTTVVIIATFTTTVAVFVSVTATTTVVETTTTTTTAFVVALITVSSAGVKLSRIVWTALLGKLHAQVATLEILSFHGFNGVLGITLLHEAHEREPARLGGTTRARDVHITDLTKPGNTENGRRFSTWKVSNANITIAAAKCTYLAKISLSSSLLTDQERRAIIERGEGRKEARVRHLTCTRTMSAHHTGSRIQRTKGNAWGIKAKLE